MSLSPFLAPLDHPREDVDLDRLIPPFLLLDVAAPVEDLLEFLLLALLAHQIHAH